MRINNDTAWKLYEELREFLGTPRLLDEIIMAIDQDEFNDTIEYIARMHGFDYEGEEE